jgi:NADH-quinone oxidoreductase subunit F
MTKNIEIKICMGTGGMAAGGNEVMEAFHKELNDAGVAASVERFCSLHKVGCRGLCARDVLVDVIVNGKKTTYQYVKPGMVSRVVEEHIINGEPVAEWSADKDYYNFHEKQTKVVLSDCGNINPEEIESYIAVGGYGGLKKVLRSYSQEKTIKIIQKSGIRGRGGAGFPTGLKWELCNKNRNRQKYIICNADEGDPGAFMDRSIIEGNPHAVIEGMIIGAYAIGATKGYVYIRAEYPLAVERLKNALDQAREKNLLGKNILGKKLNFDVRIKLGAGAFVCGEETALIASIEGQRGMPRAKPPFPVQSGLWGRPTVINNVETLANIPYIIRNGPDWFSSFGTEKSRGTKVFALTGKVRNTGLIEVPMGITLREIIYDIGGGIPKHRKLKAVQTGGPSGGCIPSGLVDINMDFESLARVGSIVGSGGMVVLDDTDCMVNIAKFFLEFTQAESCGKCVPCRVGTKRLLEILDRITAGRGREGDIELLEDLGNDIKSSSLCGLGQTAPNPILSTINYFRDEYEAHIREMRCPAGVCRELIEYGILEKMCKGCGACLRACPAGAIAGEKKKPHTISTDMCIKCGACFDVCKFDAVHKEWKYKGSEVSGGISDS